MKLRLAEEKAARAKVEDKKVAPETESSRQSRVSHSGVAMRVARVSFNLKKLLVASVERRAAEKRAADEHEAMLARKKKRLQKNERVKARLDAEQGRRKVEEEARMKMRQEIKKGISDGIKRKEEERAKQEKAKGTTTDEDQAKETYYERMQRMASFASSVQGKETGKAEGAPTHAELVSRFEAEQAGRFK